MTMEDMDKLVSSFANRLAAGEVMEEPHDLQFYGNNSDAIEKALRQIQIVDEARAKYAANHTGDYTNSMTKRVFGVKQWGTLDEQEAINLLVDLRRRFE